MFVCPIICYSVPIDSCSGHIEAYSSKTAINIAKITAYNATIAVYNQQIEYYIK